MSVRIGALWLYPVKGMAGIALEEAKLLPTGIEGDRQWLVVDAQQRAMTQRECPALARIIPDLNAKRLRLSAPDFGSCQPADGEAPVTVSIFGKPAQALAADAETDRWLSEYLGAPVRLVRFDQRQRRHCDPSRFGDHTLMFADAAPYLVAGAASLTALNRNRDPRRFRANIWLEGLPPFAEHGFTTLTAPAARLQLVDPCKRCVVILVDPDRGERTESGSWLLDIAVLNAMPGQPSAPAFGLNATLAAGANGYLRVGEPVTLS